MPCSRFYGAVRRGVGDVHRKRMSNHDFPIAPSIQAERCSWSCMRQIPWELGQQLKMRRPRLMSGAWFCPSR